MSSPQFSVIVPLYNKELSIAATLQSVIAQSCTDFELIVVDDGSTDGSWGAAQQVSDARIRSFRQANQGESGARNTGIAQAQGTYLAFLDADDLWEPQHLERIAQLIDRFPQAGIFAAGYRVQFNGRAERAPALARLISGETSLIEDYFMAMVRGPLFILPSCCVVPARVFEQVGVFGLGQKLGADQDMWSRISLHFPIALCRDVTVIYREDAENRACDIHRIREELPYSSNLQSALDADEVPSELKRSVRLYIQFHLLNVVRDLFASGAYRRGFCQMLDRRLCCHPFACFQVMWHWLQSR